MSATPTHVQVDSRGRVNLPADLRRAAGIEEGSEIVAVSYGPGRVLLETQQAVTEAVWAAAPDPDTDSVADVRRMRDEDVAISEADAELRRQVDVDEKTSRERGEALLRELGL
jgi:bifunctional DNA-binding transcriptional regulator/antitoxin component of YhaV-PrlF toxin-antitoxin module